VWTPEAAAELSDRSAAIKASFNGDSATAVASAEQLVNDAAQSLVQALIGRRLDLSDWHRDEVADDEQLRSAMNRYLDYVEKILAL
jgi:hypothetical protein